MAEVMLPCDSMTRDEDTFTLSTGRQFTAVCGAIGMSEKLVMVEGYDGIIREARDASVDSDDDEEPPLTADERAEVAAYLTDLWQRWAARC